MAKSVGEFLKSQDAFGHAVTINYRGDNQYRTTQGAILTLMQKIFILVVSIVGLIDLFSYKDPNVTQYTIYDDRLDDQGLNFEDNYGFFIFALKKYDGTNVALEPQYGTLKLYQSEFDLKSKNYYRHLEEISVDEYTKENFPQEFDDEVMDETLLKLGTFYSSKEFDKINFKHLATTNQSQFLQLYLYPCQQNELHDGQMCADEQEIANFFNKSYIQFYEVKNFIDYRNVVEKPLKRLALYKFSTVLDINQTKSNFLQIVETQVSLQDNLWQLFVNPTEFSILNISQEQPGEVVTEFYARNQPIFFMQLSLSSEILISERVVTDAVTLFGDIGGISALIMTIFSLLVGSFPTKMFNISVAQTLFRQTKQQKRTPNFVQTHDVRCLRPKFGPFKLTFCQKLSYILCSGLQSSSTSKYNRMIGKSRAKIEQILDLRSIVRNQRANKTLQRLLIISKSVRKLISLQRRTTVIEKKKAGSQSSSSSTSDHCSLNQEQERKLLQQVRSYKQQMAELRHPVEVGVQQKLSLEFSHLLERGVFDRDIALEKSRTVKNTVVSTQNISQSFEAVGSERRSRDHSIANNDQSFSYNNARGSSELYLDAQNNNRLQKLKNQWPLR